MDGSDSQRRAVRRTSAANAIVGSLVMLTFAVPIILGWNSVLWIPDSQIGGRGPAGTGVHTSAAVLSQYRSGKGVKLDYVFRAGDSDIVDSLWVPYHPDEFSRPYGPLPIIYDSANPRNHVVESAMISPAAVRLNVASVLLYLAAPFGAFAIGTELSVRRQMRYARIGVRTTGTVLRLGQEIRVHTRRGGGTWEEVRMVILYEYFTDFGLRCEGKAEAGAAFSPDFADHWPELFYDPDCPPRHMRLDQMWAVNWRGDYQT